MISRSSFWCGDPALALLLEAVQDEHRFLKLHRVDRAVRATRVVFDHFQDTNAAEALEHLRRVVPITMLGEVQGVTEELPHLNRQRHQVFLAAPDPDQRFF